MGELTGKHNVRIAFNAGTFSDGVETRLGVHVEKSPDNQQILTFQDVKSDGKEGLTQEEYNEIANALRKLEGFQEEWLSKINYINEQVTSKYGISPSTTGDDSTGEEDKQLEKFRKQYLEGGVTGTERRAAAFGKCMGSLEYGGQSSLFLSIYSLQCSSPNPHQLANRVEPFGSTVSGTDQRPMLELVKRLPEAGRYAQIKFNLPAVAANPIKFAALLKRIEQSLEHNPELQRRFRENARDIVQINDANRTPYDAKKKEGTDKEPLTISYSEVKSLITIWNERAVEKAQAERQRTGKHVAPRMPPKAQQPFLAAQEIKDFCEIVTLFAAAEEEMIKNYTFNNQADGINTSFKIKDLPAANFKGKRIDDSVQICCFEQEAGGKIVVRMAYLKEKQKFYAKMNQEDLSKLIQLVEERDLKFAAAGTHQPAGLAGTKQEVLYLLRMALDGFDA